MKKLVSSLAGLALAVAAPAGATTAAQLSNEALTDKADLIVIGRAGAQRTLWVDRQLVTLVTVTVSESLKGDAGASLTVALPGGVDAKRRFPVSVSWPGAPTLAPEEEVFLFLVSTQEVKDAYAVAGFSQGKFSIVQEHGVTSVSRDLSRVDLTGPRGTRRGTRSSASLAGFKDEIRSYLKRRSSGGGQ